MPIFTFDGFAVGSDVTLLVDQNSQSAAGSVSGWGQGALGSFEISMVSSGESIAPSGVWFEARNLTGGPDLPAQTGIYDSEFHEITWVWDFGDTPETLASLNVPSAWKNAGTAYGRQVAHVFTDAGAFTVNCKAYYNGQLVAEASETINVGDPDAIYTSARTILVDPDGIGDTTTYPGAVVVTSLAAAGVELQSRGAGGNTCRILIKRGITITDAQISISNGFVDSIPNFRMGAYGSGTKPVLRLKDQQFDNNLIVFGANRGAAVNMRDICFCDIRIQGGWDPTIENGVNQFEPIRMLHSEGCYVLHDCEFAGFSSCGTGIGNDAEDESLTLYSKCDITDFSDYGISSTGNTGDPDPSSRIAVVNCNIAQNVDALDGGPKVGFYNSHGCPIRINAQKTVYIGMSSFFAKGGWSVLGNTIAGQPCIRLMQANPGITGAWYNLDRVFCEGAVAISAADANAGQNWPWNCTIDKIAAAATGNSFGNLVTINYGGTTIRNAYGFIPAVDTRQSGNPINGLITTTDINENNGNNDEPFNIHDCTIVSLRTTANEDWVPGVYNIFEPDPARMLDTENFVNHQPNLDTPVDADAPINLSADLGVVLKTKGFAFNFRYVEGTLSETVGNGASFAVPYASIGTGLSDTTAFSGSTDQAYWQAFEAIDTRHRLTIGPTSLFAERAEFTIAFEAGGVRITNTSGATWQNGTGWRLQLDRASRLPSLDPTLANAGVTMPVPRPEGISLARNTGDGGRRAYDDLLGIPRPASGDEKGALLEL